MYRLLDFIIGYVTVKLGGDGALGLVNLLKNEGMKFGSPRVGENCYYIKCSVFHADAIKARLDQLGADYEISEKRGVSFAAYRYRGRSGLLVGAFIAMLIVFGSTRVIWDVRVDCNGDYDESAVLSALSKLGVECGKPISAIDVYNTELTFLVQNPQFSDVALNIQGTVAAVRLRVRTESPRQEEKTGAFDVVAAEAGVIRGVSAIKGVPVVKRGDTVDKGDVLISGVMQGAYGEYYIHHACGSVTASVYREYTAVIPLKANQKVYTGKSKTKTSFVILGKRADLFISELSPYAKCDAETAVSPVTAFGLRLPIVKESVTYREYTVVPRELTEEEAELQAKASFEAFLEREIEGEIISSSFECRYDGELDAVVISGIAEVVTEIGVEVEMQTIPEPPDVPE